MTEMTRQEKGKEKEIMKRWLSILLVLAMAISLCAFGGMAQAADTDKSYVKNRTGAADPEE